MARKPRCTPGMVTVVSKELRIINGDVESLQKMRKRGRPKKLENLIPVVPGTPDYPQFADVKDADITFRDQFRVVRSEKDKNQKKINNQALQSKFDELASEVREVGSFAAIGQTERLERWHDGKWARFDFDKVGRIERSVPSSFCSCKQESKDEYMSCIIHGLKQPECDCGGIDGITGYRMCSGHRSSGHAKGVRNFEGTDRTRAAAKAADDLAREIGWI